MKSNQSMIGLDYGYSESTVLTFIVSSETNQEVTVFSECLQQRSVEEYKRLLSLWSACPSPIHER